jgi:hypothetical protein
MKDDTDEIIRRLEGDPEAILNNYWPGWIKVGSKALLTPKLKEKQKKPTSSFILNLSGKHRNQWYRFSQDKGGGLIALIYYSETGGSVPSNKAEWADAFRFARAFLGMEQSRQLTDAEKRERDERRERDRAEREERRRQDEKVAAEARAERTLSAKQVWQETIALAGSWAERYLVEERGLPPVSEWPWDCSDVLRFHPSLASEMEPEAGEFPAFIAKVQDPFGNGTAVWQVFLDRNAPKKAPLSLPRVGRGPMTGGAVRIGGDAERIGDAEGLETTLGFWFLENCRKPIWATLSTSGLIGFEPPIFVKHVSIYMDGDKGVLQKSRNEDEARDRGRKVSDPPGLAAAKAHQSRLLSVGVGCNINEMPFLLGDGNDLWKTRRNHEKAV